jgi:hypothetical protein
MRPRAALPVVGVLFFLLFALPLGAAPDDGPPKPQGSTPDQMAPANKAAGALLAERLRRDRPEDYRILRCIRPRDLLVVQGAYDHVEWVLRQVGVPFATCAPQHLARRSLHGVEIVLVNCPGRIGRDGARRLRSFVDRGGLLFTTDWAALHVIEPAFPRTIRYTRRPTRDDVVSIRVVRPEHLFLKHVLTGGDRHRWWLESQSYPVQVLDRRRVEVLIDSEEMRRKYGSGPIAVTFRSGRGRVVHIVSHFYLQRSELRSRRDKLPLASFAGDLGFAPGTPVVRKLGREGLADVSAGELRSAYSAQQFLANLLIEAKRGSAPPPRPDPPRPDPPDPDDLPPPVVVSGPQAVAARDVVLLDAPDGTPFRAVSAGLRLRVIERRTGWLQVRTPSGVVGWLRPDAVRE